MKTKMFSKALACVSAMHIYTYYTNTSCQIYIQSNLFIELLMPLTPPEVFKITEQLKHDIKYDKMECAGSHMHKCT